MANHTACPLRQQPHTAWHPTVKPVLAGLLLEYQQMYCLAVPQRQRGIRTRRLVACIRSTCHPTPGQNWWMTAVSCALASVTPCSFIRWASCTQWNPFRKNCYIPNSTWGFVFSSARAQCESLLDAEGFENAYCMFFLETLVVIYFSVCVCVCMCVWNDTSVHSISLEYEALLNMKNPQTME